jgi:hypothetical protein
MSNQELLELVQRGANGVGDVSTEAARKACKVILENNYLGGAGWPVKPPVKPSYNAPEGTEVHTKKVWAQRPDDKGYKMAAKKSGMCNICTGPIAIGEDIYFKSGSGANHVACADEAAKLVP